MKTFIYVVLSVMILSFSTPCLSDGPLVLDTIDKDITVGASHLDESLETSSWFPRHWFPICGGSVGGVPINFCAASSQDIDSNW